MELLRINGLRKKVNDNFTLNINNLSLNKGEFMIMIGKNGAGKTTLSRIICGFLSFDAGDINIDGISIKNNKEIGRLIGYVQQSKGLPEELTVNEYLKHQMKMKKCSEEELGMLITVSQLDYFKMHRISALSEGNKRKLHILSSILHKPKLLIMDEPTIGLDPLVRVDIYNYISGLRKLNISAIISTHYLDEVKYLGDKISIIDNGEIILNCMKNDLKNFFGNEYGIEIELNDKNKVDYMKEYFLEKTFDFIKHIEHEAGMLKIFTDEHDIDYIPLIVEEIAKAGCKIVMIKKMEMSIENFLLDVMKSKKLNLV